MDTSAADPLPEGAGARAAPICCDVLVVDDEPQVREVMAMRPSAATRTWKPSRSR
ncbi:MAG: hypothetical protein AAGK32_08590 [Actinomycetota bacterium]